GPAAPRLRRYRHLGRARPGRGPLRPPVQRGAGHRAGRDPGDRPRDLTGDEGRGRPLPRRATGGGTAHRLLRGRLTPRSPTRPCAWLGRRSAKPIGQWSVTWSRTWRQRWSPRVTSTETRSEERRVGK